MTIVVTVTPTTKSGYAIHALARRGETGQANLLSDTVRDTTMAAVNEVRLSNRDIFDYNYIVSFEEQRNA